MRILINDKRIDWIFVAFIILYYNVDGTISYILAAIYVVYNILISKKIQKIKYLIPIICMVIVGGIVGVSNIGIDYIRDIYYFTQPIIYIYCGYFLDNTKGKKYDYNASIVIAAFILAFIYIILVIQNSSILMQSDNVRDIRDEVGKETFVTLVGVVLLATQRIGINRYKKYIIFFVLILTFALQFSRASVGTIAVFFLSFYLLEERKRDIRVLRKIAVGLCVIILIILLIPNSLMSDFIDRLLKSSTEISPNSVKVWTRDNAYTNWRGYEIYLVIEAFKNGTLFQKIFGYGFGNRVLLGKGITLYDLTSIPVFHNGYIQVLNKVGLIGESFLFIFYTSILQFALKCKNIEYEDLYKLSRFVFSLLCGVIFLAYFKGGIFKGTSVIEIMLYIGFLINRYKNIMYIEKEEIIHE